MRFSFLFSGILGVGEMSLSYVTVEFLGTTTVGQSSHHVNVLDDGSFTMSSDWILETSGKHEISEAARANLLCLLIKK